MTRRGAMAMHHGGDAEKRRGKISVMLRVGRQGGVHHAGRPAHPVPDIRLSAIRATSPK